MGEFRADSPCILEVIILLSPQGEVLIMFRCFLLLDIGGGGRRVTAEWLSKGARSDVGRIN